MTIMPYASTVKLPQLLRSLRITWLVLFAAHFVYGFGYSIILPKPISTVPPKPVFVIEIGMVAVLDVAVALFLFARKVRAPRIVLQQNPEDATALKDWRIGVIVVSVLAESVSLFGFLLYAEGVGPVYRLPFILVGLAIALLAFPTNPG